MEPILNIAGPTTGLLIQPPIGAISDRTWSPKWGRRRPFVTGGAILCTVVYGEEAAQLAMENSLRELTHDKIKHFEQRGWPPLRPRRCWRRPATTPAP